MVPLNKSMTLNSQTACIFVITLTGVKWQCVIPTFHIRDYAKKYQWWL